MTWEELAAEPGKWHLYYGTDGRLFKLDRQVFEVLEDEDDGYRSCMDSVVEQKGYVFPERSGKKVRIETINSTFIRTKDDPVRCVDSGYCLVDEKGNTALEFGTDNEDTYYPSFVFSEGGA